MNTANVYIIIPIHNRKHLSLACLENLRVNGDLQKYQIVIVDDGSSDGSTEAIRLLYPEVILLSGDGNLWWTGAITLGMQYAYEHGAEYLIWLNDDCQHCIGTIDNLVTFAQTHQDVIVGCQGVEPENPNLIVFGGKVKTWQGYRFINPPANMVVPCDLLSGNIVCLPRSVIEKIGYPDLRITPHYGGDSLYLILAQKTGFLIYVDTRSRVHSIAGASKLYPQKWLLGEGKALDILKLVFVPQSGLSWRVWLKLNWEAYSVWGIVMFLKKYVSILIITGLRFLPLSIRYKLFANTHG
ncbi:putative glycosyltransferase [Synechococcus sp. PCC 7502]|uniref:glycosyltransferase family 2 protein n=1 Tax=Synechococcus sp. PCC 7502 TaxID=1173263 RepID=UPI00029FDD57|nr:glycosyltransferase family 2 protein [Synechococcus sp. PCC 7502]AFY75203.1 putative glycosyltransferase [Synechococcus sp. PCC 7502]